MNTIKDKVILITGGGQGLGASICKNLAGVGGIVIPVDINPRQVHNVLDGIINSGGKGKSYIMDVGDEKNVENVIGNVVEEYGKLDFVINNAGIDFTKSFTELSLEEWDKVIRVNLRGPFLVSKIAFPYLEMNGSGHIVNIASTASKRSWANASAYHASKWGLLGFNHALHVEARKKNIKVTAVIAGGMQTPFILERFPDTDLNVLQDPDHVAETVRYVLTQPEGTVIPEVMVIPMGETSWP
jgi:NAD(P)-dependent dehydrogenase (short-subunit alcohol dehydrogenase family)